MSTCDLACRAARKSPLSTSSTDTTTLSTCASLVGARASVTLSHKQQSCFAPLFFPPPMSSFSSAARASGAEQLGHNARSRAPLLIQQHVLMSLAPVACTQTHAGDREAPGCPCQEHECRRLRCGDHLVYRQLHYTSSFARVDDSTPIFLKPANRKEGGEDRRRSGGSGPVLSGHPRREHALRVWVHRPGPEGERIRCAITVFGCLQGESDSLPAA